jgi:hypothetical protein
MTNVTAGISDDYAVLSNDYTSPERLMIYYGYEHTTMPDGREGTDADQERAYEGDGPEPKWAGMVRLGERQVVIPADRFDRDKGEAVDTLVDLVGWLLSTGALRLDMDALDAALSA